MIVVWLYESWLLDDKHEDLHRTTDAYPDEFVVHLGCKIGLRSFEIPQITPEYLRRSVQRIVKTVAERTAERTGNDDFQKASSHDLRRYFAHTCLVEKRMNPRVVMEIGVGGLRSAGTVSEQAESQHYRRRVREH